jgi:hypothetical protein
MVEMDKAEINTIANSTYKKMSIRWLSEVLCFVSSLILADSLMLLCLPPGIEIANFLKLNTLGNGFRMQTLTIFSI